MSAETDALQVQINDVRRGDGALVNGIVTEDSLEAGLRDTLVGDVAGTVQPLVDQASASAVAAAGSASTASSRATAAGTSRDQAAGSAVAAESARIAAVAAEAGAVVAKDAAEAAVVTTGNSANSAAGSAAAAELAEELAAQWAEYLAGPVAVNEIPPDGLPPEAVESGYFSARWWANRAEQIVDLTGKWYLGPYDSDPTEAVLGSPLVEGMYYWNTVDDTFRVWTGSIWADWSLSVGISTVLVTSDATSDLEADVAAAFNDYANRNSFVRGSGELLFFIWPASGGATYLYTGTDGGDPGPWASTLGEWAIFSADTYAPLTHFRDNGARAEILDDGEVRVATTAVGARFLETTDLRMITPVDAYSKFAVENSVVGGVGLDLINGTGVGRIVQLDPAGAVEQRWVTFDRDGGANFYFGDVEIAAIAVDGLDMQGYRVKNVGAPVANDDAVRKVDVDVLDTRLTTEEGLSVSLGTSITAIEANIDTVENSISVQGALINSIDAALTTAEGDILTNAGAVSALDVRLTSAEGSVTSQASDITTLESAVNDPTTGNAALGTAQTALTARVTTAEGSISSQSSQITTLTARVSTAEGSITSQGSAIATLQTDVTNLSSESARITALENTVDNPTTGVAANAAAVSSLQTQVTNNDSDIAAQASDITTLQADVTNIENGTTAIPGVAANAGAITALDARVTTAEGDISSQASLITGLDSRVTTAEGTIASQGSAISTLETEAGLWASESARIDALESTVNNGSTGVAANASAVSTLNTRVTTAEGSIAAQASDITSLQTTVGGHTTSISTNVSSINGIQAKYGVKVDNNGYVSGFGLLSEANNGAVVSTFDVLADVFKVSHPSVSGGAPQTVFTASGGTLRVQNLEVLASLIAGTINASQLNLDGITLQNSGGELQVAGVDWSTHIGGAGKPADNATANVSVLGYFTAGRTGNVTLLSAAGITSGTLITGWSESIDSGVDVTVSGGNTFIFNQTGRYEISCNLRAFKETGGSADTSWEVGILLDADGAGAGGYSARLASITSSMVPNLSTTVEYDSMTVTDIIDVTAGARIQFWGKSRNTAPANEMTLISTTGQLLTIKRLNI